MHTRAAVAVFDAEASSKIVIGKATSDRSMSRPFPTAAYWYAEFCVGQQGHDRTRSMSQTRRPAPRQPGASRLHEGRRRSPQRLTKMIATPARAASGADFKASFKIRTSSARVVPPARQEKVKPEHEPKGLGSGRRQRSSGR